MPIWNPWHGCHKISPGCAHCYMYRRDAMFDKDSSIVTRTSSFDLPVQRKRDGTYKLQSDSPVYACMTSDFFVEEADEYRKTAWAYIRERSDLQFVIITKRIERFYVSLPGDWGDGYDNVTVCSTCENQETADRRLSLMKDMPIKHRKIVHEPMLEKIDISRYLATGLFEHVTCGGESGEGARVCDYDWILNTREQCLRYGVTFWFKQTGACFRKDGRLYRIERKYQLSQANKANINIT